MTLTLFLLALALLAVNSWNLRQSLRALRRLQEEIRMTQQGEPKEVPR